MRPDIQLRDLYHNSQRSTSNTQDISKKEEGLSHKSLEVIARNPACHIGPKMAGREVTKRSGQDRPDKQIASAEIASQ